MTRFESTAEAFRNARRRASVADHLTQQLLHVAVFDAREAGMSIRQTARALRVSRSMVARHWREDHRDPDTTPVWGDEAEYRAAHAAVWQHDPDSPDGADTHVPYEWIDLPDGSRQIRQVYRGTAHLRHDPSDAD